MEYCAPSLIAYLQVWGLPSPSQHGPAGEAHSEIGLAVEGRQKKKVGISCNVDWFIVDLLTIIVLFLMIYTAPKVWGKCVFKNINNDFVGNVVMYYSSLVHFPS